MRHHSSTEICGHACSAIGAACVSVALGACTYYPPRRDVAERAFDPATATVALQVEHVANLPEISPATDAAWAIDPVTGAPSVLVVSQTGAAWFDPESGIARYVPYRAPAIIPRITRIFTIVEPGLGRAPIALLQPGFGDHIVSAWDPATGRELWTYSPAGEQSIQVVIPVRDRQGNFSIYVQREWEEAIDQISIDGLLIRRHAWSADFNDVHEAVDLGPHGTAMLFADRGFLRLRDVDGNELWSGTPNSHVHFIQAVRPVASKDCLLRIWMGVTEYVVYAFVDTTSYYLFEVRDVDGVLSGSFTNISRERPAALPRADAVGVQVGDETLYLSRSRPNMPGSEHSTMLRLRDNAGDVRAEQVVTSADNLLLAQGQLLPGRDRADEAWLVWSNAVYRVRAVAK